MSRDKYYVVCGKLRKLVLAQADENNTRLGCLRAIAAAVAMIKVEDENGEMCYIGDSTAIPSDYLGSMFYVDKRGFRTPKERAEANPDNVFDGGRPGWQITRDEGLDFFDELMEDCEPFGQDGEI